MNEVYQDKIDKNKHYYKVKIELYDYTVHCCIECDDIDDFAIIKKASNHLNIDENDIKDYQINVISRLEME